MAFQEITIVKAINEIQANRFVLPAIQREFVWNARQIERLFDSLMRGYPIGHSYSEKLADLLDVKLEPGVESPVEAAADGD